MLDTFFSHPVVSRIEMSDRVQKKADNMSKGKVEEKDFDKRPVLFHVQIFDEKDFKLF